MRATKDSGVDWLGEIPADWDVLPARALFRNPSEPSKPDDIHLTPSQKYGVLPQSEYMEISGSRVVLNLSGSEQMRHVAAGDFISHLRSFQGGLEYSQFEGKVSNAYTVLRPRRSLVAGYFKHLFKSTMYVQGLQTTTDQLRDGQSIRFKQLSLLALPEPPLEEQRRIADFLDRETAKIDALIAKQEQLITTLDERRGAVISRAVTRGIVEGRPLRESGVEWLGEIPVEWEVRPLWAVADFSTGWTPPTGNDNFYTGDIPWVNISDLGPRTVVETSKHLSSEAVSEQRLRKTLSGQLMFSFKLSIGQVSFAGMDCYTNEAIASFGSSKQLDLSFAFYMFPIAIPENASENIYGAKMLNARRIKSARIILPPLREQKQISDFLDRETNQIDESKSQAIRMKGLLLERRQALISAAVTGKLEVTDGYS